MFFQEIFLNGVHINKKNEQKMVSKFWISWGHAATIILKINIQIVSE